MSVGAAKVIAESGYTRDFWANTRIESGQTVKAYGRVPGEANSWRQPVDTNIRNATPLTDLSPQYDQAKLQRLFRTYMPKWETLASKMTLFANGVKGKDHSISVENKDMTLWENDDYKVSLMQPGADPMKEPWMHINWFTFSNLA